jgi:hypothetical protein
MEYVKQKAFNIEQEISCPEKSLLEKPGFEPVSPLLYHLSYNPRQI